MIMRDFKGLKRAQIKQRLWRRLLITFKMSMAKMAIDKISI